MLPDVRLVINNELTLKTQVENKLIFHHVRNSLGTTKINRNIILGIFFTNKYDFNLPILLKPLALLLQDC